MEKPLTYSDAGVDIDKKMSFIHTIKEIAKTTPRTGVMDEIGGFGGLYSLSTLTMERPVLVSSTDGVGTKLNIAFMTDKHDTVGIDLVAMSVNDIVVQGAKPLFFLDYIAMGSPLNIRIASEIIRGVGEGCKQAGCALIGGETAEMPGFYPENHYDLAGFAIGIVDNDKIIDGSDIRVGHRLISIPSSGLHSNGYSLVRKICFDHLKLDVSSVIPDLDKTLGEELLTPTRIYSEVIQRLIRDLPIHGLAHITGGGLVDNIIRIVPKACNVLLRKNSWYSPPIFQFLQQAGKISDMEMMRTFNNGIGMVVITPEKDASDVLERLTAMNEKAFIIGEIIERKSSEPLVKWD